MLVVKYQNRKLYSKTESKYITVPELGNAVKRGENVIVIDNQTKNDITAECLAQYIGQNARNLNQVTEFIRGME